METLDRRSLGERAKGLVPNNGLTTGSDNRLFPFKAAFALADGGCFLVTTGDNFRVTFSCVLVRGEGDLTPGEPLGGEILEPLPLPFGDPPWILPRGDLAEPPGAGEPLPLPEFWPPGEIGETVAEVVLRMLDCRGERVPPLKLPMGEPRLLGDILPPGGTGEIWDPVKLPLGEPVFVPPTPILVGPRFADSGFLSFDAVAEVDDLVPNLPLDCGDPDAEPGTETGDLGLGLGVRR